MVDSKEFAKYVVLKAQNKNIPLNLTQLQKITYICDGLLLACDINFINEHCRVWTYGPVYPKIYKWYSKLKGKKIAEEDIKPEVLTEINNSIVPTLVELVLDKFGKWTSVQLSDWSHQKGSPWDIARSNSGMYSKIDKDDMKSFFKGLANG